MQTKYTIERWTGKAWDKTMCSPYNSITEAHKHLKDYWWHYTEEHPYRLVEYKPKKKNIFKRMLNIKAHNDWNSDNGMVVINRVMK